MDLVHPGVSVDKTGPDRSKDGDQVTYTIEICNTGDVDLVEESIVDDLLGDLADSYGDDLIVGECESHDFPYTVDESATGDPVVNTVEVHYDVGGTGAPLTNDIWDEDDHSINLFHPDYTLACWTAADIYTVGDTINYRFTIDDLSDPDTPDMALLSALSNLLGDVSGSFPDPLADDVVWLPYTVQLGDPETLVHGVTTVYSPVGFPNEYDRYAQCTVTIKFGCMYSPGFWGGGEGVQKWDDEGLDPVAIAAGFYTGTPFPWVDSSEFPGGLSYLEVLGLPAHGDVTIQLSFKYIAARLNVALADVLSLPVHSGLEDLLDEIDLYFASNPVGSKPTGQARDDGRDLLEDLNLIFSAVGEDYCPATGDVPEYPWP
jgi:uncharacterized repeat protein (TIGR01451 family)